MEKNYVGTGNMSLIAAFNANMKYDNFSKFQLQENRKRNQIEEH